MNVCFDKKRGQEPFHSRVDNLDAGILSGRWKAVRSYARTAYYHFDGLGSVVALTEENSNSHLLNET